MPVSNKVLRKYIDISVPVSPELPRWPGSPEIQFQRSLDLNNGDIATDTTINFSVHTGTHVDAPSHFISEGNTVDQLDLDVMMGMAYVAVFPDDVEFITADLLNNLPLPAQIKRLLLRTRNSYFWQIKGSEFQKDFVGLTADAAQWIVDQGIQLIGIDYLSVQRYYDGPATHQILLDAEVVIIEGLNLDSVSEGIYELICLPIKLKGIEGAPARVVLRYFPEHT
ncbi:cyclase family protein [Synechocystis sp. PCC 7338]|uniref:cyclase family protein n=1 Tax=Synechocystis sp. PCC 7338 TaxID=2732530 RepID=UPI001BB0D367|nr:cyclase family protein [Synechocystis sp. PCC 7338]QUS59970.1 cyclase family protein [Synechocystis sp. PCC 7338]